MADREYYNLVKDLVAFTKQSWDQELVDSLLELFKPLHLKVCGILKKRYPLAEDLLNTIQSFFLELVHEYDPNYRSDRKESIANFQGVYFCQYVRTHLLYRVEKFILQTMHKRKNASMTYIEDMENIATDHRFAADYDDPSHDRGNIEIFTRILKTIWQQLGDLGEDIAIMLFLGFKQVEIARIIGSTQPTVSHHCRSIRNVLGGEIDQFSTWLI